MNFKNLLIRKQHRYALTALLLLNTATSLADDELFFEMPMVLSANRLEQAVSDAAVSITVIDRETIEASGARTIPEVLRLVPGMQVGYSGNEFGDAPKYVVTYHGHSDQYSKQMQVLVDGRSIYEPLLGGIQWKAIPVNIDDIERIEVSRGPNLATYGANSFMAAINIITRTATEDHGSYLRSNVGNHDIADLTYRYGGRSGKLDYRITASTLNDDGLDSGNDNENPDDTSSHNIDYRLDYQINNHNSLSYQGGFGENRQQADRNHEAVIPMQRTIKTTRFFQFLKWESVINAQNTLQLQYYYNLSEKNDSYRSDIIDLSPFGLPFDPFYLDVSDDQKAERHALELTHSIYPNNDLKLIWGISAQTDQVRAPLALGVDKKIEHQQYRIFSNAEWRLSTRNVINIGALAEKNEFTKTEVSPRFSITHAFNKQHKIRFGISKAIRNPYIYEDMANVFFTKDLTTAGNPTGITARELIILGNSDLKNEKITSREIVYVGNFFNTSLLFNARFFHDDIVDFIDTLRVPVDSTLDNVTGDAPIFSNPFDSETTGLEVEIDYHIDSSLRLIASGAIININSKRLSVNRSAPQHSYSILLTKIFNEKYNTSLGYYFVENFHWTDSSGTGDYKILDIRLSRNFHVNQTHGRLSLVLKNLLDDYSDYKENPRNSTSPKIIQNTVAYIDFRLDF